MTICDVALTLEVRFIDESDFVNKIKGFIVKDNPDWEIDSSISLDLADSLDDISDFEQELKSAEYDSASGISSSSATHDNDYGEGTSATKNSKRKKPTAKNRQRRGHDRRPQQSKQPKPLIDLNSSQSSAATSTRIRSNKNTNKKTNYGGNQNRKTTKMLTTEKELGDVIMKLEGKRPKC